MFAVHLSTDTNNNIIFNITNNSSSDYYVCSDENPLEGPAGSQLLILDKFGTEVEYEGIECERLAPEDNKISWILLPKGQTISKVVDISVYPLKKGVEYTIQLNSKVILYSSNNKVPINFQKQDIISNKISWTC